MNDNNNQHRCPNMCWFRVIYMPIFESMSRRGKIGNEIEMHKKHVERNNCRTFFCRVKELGDVYGFG